MHESKTIVKSRLCFLKDSSSCWLVTLETWDLGKKNVKQKTLICDKKFSFFVTWHLWTVGRVGVRDGERRRTFGIWMSSWAARASSLSLIHSRSPPCSFKRRIEKAFISGNARSKLMSKFAASGFRIHFKNGRQKWRQFGKFLHKGGGWFVKSELGRRQTGRLTTTAMTVLDYVAALSFANGETRPKQLHGWVVGVAKRTLSRLMSSSTSH